jgi:membrane fusion protein, multidrug efflux system
MDSGPEQFGQTTRGGAMGVSRVQTLILLLIALDLPACDADGPQPQKDARKITLAVVQSKSATIKQPYHCRIESHSRIHVPAPVEGRLAAILVRTGQAVKRGDLLFQVGPPTNEENPGAENREKVVSIKAPCDGLVVGQPSVQGSRVRKGLSLVTLSDSSRMWVNFDVPEKVYLEYFAPMFERINYWRSLDLELVLADHIKYPHTGRIIDIEGHISSETGDITFRAEFPNPDGVLRHGQTGTLLIGLSKETILIPQRAAIEDHARRYVFVVDKEHVAHRREIVIQDEAGDLFVVKKGVEVGDQIVVDGLRQVRDGDRVE